jgi:hypothetical protein
MAETPQDLLHIDPRALDPPVVPAAAPPSDAVLALAAGWADPTSSDDGSDHNGSSLSLPGMTASGGFGGSVFFSGTPSGNSGLLGRFEANLSVEFRPLRAAEAAANALLLSPPPPQALDFGPCEVAYARLVYDRFVGVFGLKEIAQFKLTSLFDAVCEAPQVGENFPPRVLHRRPST